MVKAWRQLLGAFWHSWQKGDASLGTHWQQVSRLATLAMEALLGPREPPMAASNSLVNSFTKALEEASPGPI